MSRRRIKLLLLNARIHVPALSRVTSPIVSAFRLLAKKPRQPGLLALKSLRLSATGLCLDVGGADGQTVATLRAHSPTAPVISFEPNEAYADRIRSRFRGDAAVKVEVLALGDREGTFPLFIPIYRNVAFPELGTFDRSEAEDWLARRVFKYDPKKLVIKELPCRLSRLDTLGLAPELVTIDGRCNASAVLRGAMDTIGKYRPILILEHSSVEPDCAGQLGGWGYRSYNWEQGRAAEVAWGKPCQLVILKDHFHNS